MPIDYSRMSTDGHQGESASDTAAIDPSLSVKPPKSFDFSKFEEWLRWVKQFKRYSVISGLSRQEGALQVNALLYAMGGKSEDIFTSFTFDDGADQNNYNRVKEKFDHHFIGEKNVIYERAKFNQCVQGQDEPVKNFITDLYCLAEFCEHGSLKD